MCLFNEARYQRVERGKGALGTMEERLAERLTENRNRYRVQPYLPVTLAASSIRLPEVRLPPGSMTPRQSWIAGSDLKPPK
jgi:hypothetical protein